MKRKKDKITKLIILLKVDAPIEHIKNDIKRKKESFDKQMFISSNNLSTQKIKSTKWVNKYYSFKDYLEQVDKFGNTAMSYAIMNGDINKVRILHEESARINYYNIFTNKLDLEKQPLKFHKELREIYREKKVIEYDLWSKYLRETLYDGPLITRIIKKMPKEIALFYLKDFRDILLKMSLNYYNINKFYKDLKKTLNKRDINGKTLLGVIVDKNYGSDFLDILVELGVDINKKYSNKLVKGKDIEYKMGNEGTSLNFQLVNKKGKYSIIFNGGKLEKDEPANLVKKRIKRYEQDEFPIHQALRKHSYKTLEALLSYTGIKERVKDNNGLTLEDKGYKFSIDLKSKNNKVLYEGFKEKSKMLKEKEKENIEDSLPF